MEVTGEPEAPVNWSVREVAPGTVAGVAECPTCGKIYTAVSGTPYNVRKLISRKYRKHRPECPGQPGSWVMTACVCSCWRCGPIGKHDCGTPACMPR